VATRLRKLGQVIRRRYLTASLFLAVFAMVTVCDAALPARDRPAVAAWASTSVANLEHHPAGSVLLSAFVAGGSAYAWPALIALAMFGANRAVGSLRLAAVCTAGHVIGTLVSEGIVAYRVDAGLLPVSARHLLDVGPSYVVVSAIAAGLALGSWPARLAAALDLAVLAFAGRIFAGLTSLDVAAVGHTTAIAVAAGCVLVIWARRARGRGRPRPGPTVGPALDTAAPAASGMNPCDNLRCE
jgi:hypothetical protein